MFRGYIYLIIALLLFATAKLQAKEKPDLVVFLTHGFMSNNNNYCDLKQVLKYSFNGKVLVHEIPYDTYGNNQIDMDNPRHRNNISVPIFAKDVLKEIHKFYYEEQLDSDTEYAVIAHSQGGLVFLRLIQDCIYDNLPYCSKQFKDIKQNFPEKLGLFYTVMSPFGGSTISNKYKDNFLFHRFLPKEQLRNLAIGSPVLNHSRNVLIRETNKATVTKIHNTKIINIAANADKNWLTNILTRWFQETPENGTLESDLAVGLPAARMDFLYYDYRNINEPRALQTRYTDHYYALRGNHTSIRTIAKSHICVEWKNFLENPIFAIINRHIRDYLKLPKRNYDIIFDNKEEIFAPNISSYQLELRIHGKKQDLVTLDYDDIVVNVRRDIRDEDKLDYITRKDDIYNIYNGLNLDSLHEGYVTFFNIGAFKDKYSFAVDRDFKANASAKNQQKLFLYIHIKGHKAQKVTAYVKPSYTTVVDVNLVK